MRNIYIASMVVSVSMVIAGATLWSPVVWLAMIVLLPLIILGAGDIIQTKQTIRRNFPILGRFRYILEKIRPEINQYFIESNTDGRPFSREERSVVYQRAKGQLDTLPFGTQKDVYSVGYEWINHSMIPTHPDPKEMRVTVGGPACKQPYSSSILNISAMSYGSMSHRAILALNGGAKDGGFAHNTGEGGLSPYHLEPGGDLIWQIGTGYFGCRTENGGFSPEKFKEKAVNPQVKMIEVKISQGAKPGHGGILPAAKVSQEVSEIRGVPMGKDVLSPPYHRAFSTPEGLLQFIAQLRDLSGGKPVGFKICLGKRREFIAICKAIVKTGIAPDFISVDGGEGGTGAAPVEFSNRIGTPGVEALIFVNNCLTGFDLRDNIKILTSGKVTTAFGILHRLMLGADIIYSARGMMMALGCIQALRCNANDCPTGVATQDPRFVKGLHVPTKRKRVHRFHDETIDSVAHMLGAMGLDHTDDLRPWHLMRRTASNEIKHYGEIYEFLEPGVLLDEANLPPSYARAYKAANAESFRVV